MIDLGLFLLLIALFASIAKRSFLSFIWTARFFFTGIAVVLLEQSQTKFELVAVTIYSLSVLTIIYTSRHLYKGRDQGEDLDSI